MELRDRNALGLINGTAGDRPRAQRRHSVEAARWWLSGASNYLAPAIASVTTVFAGLKN